MLILWSQWLTDISPTICVHNNQLLYCLLSRGLQLFFFFFFFFSVFFTSAVPGTLQYRGSPRLTCSMNGSLYTILKLRENMKDYYCNFALPSPHKGRRQWHPTPVLLPGKSHGRRAWWAAVHGVARSWKRLSDFTFTFHFHASEKEMATHSVFLPGESQGRGSLVGCRLWGRTESDTTEAT